MARGAWILKVDNMFERIRKALSRPKTGLENQIITRNIKDITISVAEGLSNTRQITISNWNPEIAFKLWKQVRDELRENPRDPTL